MFGKKKQEQHDRFSLWDRGFGFGLEKTPIGKCFLCGEAVYMKVNVAYINAEHTSYTTGVIMKDDQPQLCEKHRKAFLELLEKTGNGDSAE